MRGNPAINKPCFNKQVG